MVLEDLAERPQPWDGPTDSLTEARRVVLEDLANQPQVCVFGQARALDKLPKLDSSQNCVTSPSQGHTVNDIDFRKISCGTQPVWFSARAANR